MDQPQQQQPITLDELLTVTERENTILRAHYRRLMAEAVALQQRVAELEQQGAAASTASAERENVVELPPLSAG